MRSAPRKRSQLSLLAFGALLALLPTDAFGGGYPPPVGELSNSFTALPRRARVLLEIGQRAKQQSRRMRGLVTRLGKARGKDLRDGLIDLEQRITVSDLRRLRPNDLESFIGTFSEDRETLALSRLVRWSSLKGRHKLSSVMDLFRDVQQPQTQTHGIRRSGTSRERAERRSRRQLLEELSLGAASVKLPVKIESALRETMVATLSKELIDGTTRPETILRLLDEMSVRKNGARLARAHAAQLLRNSLRGDLALALADGRLSKNKMERVRDGLISFLLRTKPALLPGDVVRLLLDQGLNIHPTSLRSLAFEAWAGLAFEEFDGWRLPTSAALRDLQEILGTAAPAAKKRLAEYLDAGIESMAQVQKQAPETFTADNIAWWQSLSSRLETAKRLSADAASSK